MTEAVRKERRRDPSFQQCFRCTVREFRIDQYLSQHLVCLDMQVAVVHSDLNFADDTLLHLVHTVYQRLEAFVAKRVGARNVGCITVHLCASID